MQADKDGGDFLQQLGSLGSSFVIYLKTRNPSTGCSSRSA
jgi:hypothetical protein